MSKEIIIELFEKNVKGKVPNVISYNDRHDGKEGHWLEKQFGILHNAKNEADIYGYELKNQTRTKVTFGDWSANEYIFTNSKYKNIFNAKTKSNNKDIFLKIFGRPNVKKEGRLSWSGEVCPKIDVYNKYGQKMIITENKDIEVIYNYYKDERIDKAEIVPSEFQYENIVLANWYGSYSPTNLKKDICLKEKLEKKFNNKGWFTCKKNNYGEYEKICFGETINFDKWIDLVQEGIVFFDSGMYEGNSRLYSQWRANNSYWDNLIYETY